MGAGWLAWCVLVARARRRRRGRPLRGAMHELALVHRAEQAKLMREVSELMLTASPACSALLGPPATEHRLSGFHRRLTEELALAREDRVEVPVELALLECWPFEPGAAPRRGARAFARASLALEPCPLARLTLARAWLAEGAMRRALAELEKLSHSTQAPTIARGVELCHAVALDMRGDLAGAERRFVRTGPHVDAYHHAVGLALALACGDERPARRLAALLGSRRGESDAQDVRAAAERIRARLPHWRRAGARWSDGCARLVFELLCGDREAPARVALALIA